MPPRDVGVLGGETSNKPVRLEGVLLLESDSLAESEGLELSEALWFICWEEKEGCIRLVAGSEELRFPPLEAGERDLRGLTGGVLLLKRTGWENSPRGLCGKLCRLGRGSGDVSRFCGWGGEPVAESLWVDVGWGEGCLWVGTDAGAEVVRDVTGPEGESAEPGSTPSLEKRRKKDMRM
jgi:hypothetical protein